MGQDERSNVPGPSTYAPKRTRTGHGFMGHSRQSSVIGGAAERPTTSVTDPTKGAYIIASESDGHQTPGPGTYKLSASIGNQPDSRKVTSLGCSFGKAGLGNSPEKPNIPSKAEMYPSPGPGQYAVQTSMELSASAPSFSFGSTRYGKESSKDMSNLLGNSSPGPIYYPIITSKSAGVIGENGSIKFGNAERGHEPDSRATYPGPGSYPTESSMGGQVLSTHSTSGQFYFARDTRAMLKPKGDKQFISKAHEADMVGNNSPGPAYVPLCNERGGGKLGDSPQYKFGTAERTTVRIKKGPGPGAYASTAALGKQVDSQLRTEPASSFSTAERSMFRKKGDPTYYSKQHSADALGQSSPGPMYQPKTDAKGFGMIGETRDLHFPRELQRPEPRGSFLKAPGPGSYTLRQSVGGQVEGPRGQAPQYSFGFAERMPEETTAKNHMGPGFDADYLGANSPGPASYKVSSSFGSQHVSTGACANTQAPAFSLHVRRKDLGATANWVPAGPASDSAHLPGPGQYASTSQFEANGEEPSRMRMLKGKGFVMAKADRYKPTNKLYAGGALSSSNNVAPGPGTYPTAQSVGKQQSSKKQSAPAFTFSNAKRFVKTGY